MKLDVSTVSLNEIPAPEVLYKYRRWDDKYHKTILTNREVYMAPPSSFEDNKDCRIGRRFELTQLDITNMYFEISKSERPEFAIEDHMQKAIELSNETDVEVLSTELENSFSDIDSKLGILSLTEYNNSKEMWKNYANNGQGFCVGLDTKTLFRFMLGGGRVSYFDVLPLVSIYEDTPVQIWKQLLCKEKGWEFEREYRTRIYDADELSTAKRLIKLPKECIREVIFGWDMIDKHRQSIINVCKAGGLRVNIYNSYLTDGKVIISSI